MNVDQFNYTLPQQAIAVRPPRTRGSSRLLALEKKTGKIADDYYKDLANYLQPGDVVVLNNTKVIKARLLARTATGTERELLLLERHSQNIDTHRMRAMYRRRLQPGQVLRIGADEIIVEAIHGDGTATIASQADLLELAAIHGAVPLPPYMHRKAYTNDSERYQTVFAQEAGSVAAPTASLNLTESILQAIRNKGVSVHELTLHVGLGTFMPIRTSDVTQHTMHSEYFSIPADTVAAIRATKAAGKRVVAIGTTVTRTLEFAAAEVLGGGPVQRFEGEANIFIYPGYTFKVVDLLVTNFHAPQSTVLMMAAAFAGWPELKAAYEHAISAGYKLLSYGDSMVIF
jgi:S-adenosylmethionine:tRNA ribosyltransferase-isomerase